MPDIQKLLDHIAETVLQIADCHKQLAIQEDMLNSLLSQPQTAENYQYLKTMKKAYRCLVGQSKQLIVALQEHVNAIQAKIDAILAPQHCGDETDRVDNKRIAI